MSAKASNAQRMIKRFGKMAERYQDRIDRQSKIIDKLVMANAVYADLIHSIGNEATNIKQAKEMAEEAHNKVAGILAVPNDEKEANEDESRVRVAELRQAIGDEEGDEA